VDETLRPQPSVPPALATELVARDRELGGLARLLGSPDVRLLTLVGPPGAGKTRLAQAAAMARGQPPAGPARGRGPLTEREWQVASLVAEGRTSRQIAAALGVGERTVVAHLEHIFAKPDVQARAQVAAWVAGQAAEPAPAPAPEERMPLRLVR
jgi:DNA-binding CsgD family transcriptional regulator